MKIDPQVSYDNLRLKLVTQLGPESKYVKFHDDQRGLFLDMPASADSHHAWPGGYATHIDEVVFNTLWLYSNPKLGPNKPSLTEAVIAAYIHDLDKLLMRYEPDDERPTEPQLGKARGMRIPISPRETKGSISKKIDAACSGKPIPPDHELPKHRYRRDARNMDDSAAVLLLCMRHGLDGITEDIVHAVSLHHGGWAPLAVANSKVRLSPLAALLHSADLISSHVQNGDVLPPPADATQPPISP